MKFLTIIFLFFSQFSFSQEIDCPIENGRIYYNESYEFRIKNMGKPLGNPICETIVHSKTKSSVKSISNGIVSDVLDNNKNYISVLIRNNDEFYVYSNLSSISIKKEDEVKIGTLIGTISESPFSDHKIDYVLEIQLWKSEFIDIFDRLKCIKK